jgi:hypothetical protein
MKENMITFTGNGRPFKHKVFLLLLAHRATLLAHNSQKLAEILGVSQNLNLCGFHLGTEKLFVLQLKIGQFQQDFIHACTIP